MVRRRPSSFPSWKQFFFIRFYVPPTIGSLATTRSSFSFLVIIFFVRCWFPLGHPRCHLRVFLQHRSHGWFYLISLSRNLVSLTFQRKTFDQYTCIIRLIKYSLQASNFRRYHRDLQTTKAPIRWSRDRHPVTGNLLGCSKNSFPVVV